ncbi:MAG: DUF3488 and transglutaminase-like domain-containing protein [Bacteriovoracaceae bacterium]|nr:DUF3488 and transglutaminase-like domain-containing protein [Bacteriovoracaceae bacterium]
MKLDLRYILLIPAMLLGHDFLPYWYIYLYSALLLLNSLFILPRFLIYSHYVSIYYIFTTVEMRIIPETMVPLLGTFITARFIANKRNQFFEMYPFFLWLGVFAIFSSDLYYLLYAVAVFILILITQNKDQKISGKYLFKTLYENKIQILFTTILTIFLFIFFPRFYNFLPTSNIVTKGKIGYSKKVDNSGTSNLSLSSQTAFYAEIPQKIPLSRLYWRGRVHTKTDGYNWSRTKVAPLRKKNLAIDNKQFIYTLKYEQNFDGDIILLETPLKIIDSSPRVYKIDETNEYRSYITKKKAFIKAISTLDHKIKNHLPQKHLKQYLQLPNFIPKSLQAFIADLKGNSAREIIASFKQNIIRKQFSYTLTPGLMPTMNDFLNKKQGYCTHFASLMGLSLRAKDIPARLVSGFQGGSYNSVGQFYEVKSNDAHVWVEYYHKRKWHRVDPTSFVSPERIQLGGEAFLTQSQSETDSQTSNLVESQFLQVKLYFDNLNYRVSLFFDNYDRNKQKEYFQLIGSKQVLTYLALIFILIISIACIFVYFKWKKREKSIHPATKLLVKLEKKLKKDNIKFSDKNTISAMKKECLKSDSHESLIKFIEFYQLARYKDTQYLEELKQLIKQY